MISTHHLLRRGLETVQTISLNDREPGDEEPPSGKVGAFYAVFLLTCLIFLIVFSMTIYTYGHLVTTLCMVESSSSETYVPINSVEPEDDNPPEYSEDGTPKPADVEVNLIRTQPITASLRGTVRHLKARGGFRSRFRGFAVFFVWGFSHSIITGLVSGIFRSVIGVIVASIVAEVALTNLHMTWIHVVISEPSVKPWYKRMPQPARRAWKRMAPAVAIWAVTCEITAVLPMLVAGSFGALRRLEDPNFEPGMKDAYASASQLFLGAVLRVMLFVLLQIPATVTMVRVAASMLPEEDEAIVPFDRTFGGLTTPEIVGGQGKIGIVEAWRSFNWECRRRLLKTVVKIAGIVLAMYLLFTIVVVVEAQVLFGSDFGDLMKVLHRMSKGANGGQ